MVVPSALVMGIGVGGLEEIGESIGDRKRSAGVEHEGCDDRSVGGNSSRILSSRNSQRVVRRFDVTVNRIEFALGWWWDDWIRSWFGSNVGGKEDCLRFLEVNLGPCYLGRSWIGGSGFTSFSGLGGAFETDGVDAGATFSHSGIEHLGARGAFGLGRIRRWCR